MLGWCWVGRAAASLSIAFFFVVFAGPAVPLLGVPCLLRPRRRTSRSSLARGSDGSLLIVTRNVQRGREGKFKSSGIQFAVSTMQGWRRTQEDAHIVEDLGDGTTVLGVFDGHGGREVSNFAKRHFSRVLKEHKDFRSDVGAALIGAFHGIDQLLEDKANLPEVNSLKLDANDPSDDSQPGGSSSADDDNEAGDGEGADGRKVSMSEAVDLFQKLMTLKRMNAAGAQQRGGRRRCRRQWRRRCRRRRRRRRRRPALRRAALRRRLRRRPARVHAAAGPRRCRRDLGRHGGARRLPGGRQRGRLARHRLAQGPRARALRGP